MVGEMSSTSAGPESHRESSTSGLHPEVLAAGVWIQVKVGHQERRNCHRCVDAELSPMS